MTISMTARRFAAVCATAAFLAGAVPALAQTVSDSHLKAAREAISAIGATDQYDLILPQAAGALKTELIQKDPNLQDIINATVDQKALELAARRGDLEREAALAYARTFSEEDLKAITTFYSSPAGLALLKNGATVLREVAQAADIWQRGLARDLAMAVNEAMQAQVGSGQPAQAQ
jgi:hypothetical protein